MGRSREQPDARHGAGHALDRIQTRSLESVIRELEATNEELRAAKMDLQRLAAAHRYAEDIVDTVRESLVVLDANLRVRSANAAFRRLAGLAPEDIEGRRLDQLGHPELAMPFLRTLLNELCDGTSTGGLQLEYDDGAGGLRVALVNARCIANTELVLLSLEDVTEAERARTARAEVGFRAAMTGAAEGILMVDSAGIILYANPSAARLFGYEVDEMTGLAVTRLLPGRAGAAHPTQLTDDIEPAPSSRSTGRAPDVVGQRKDGTEFSIEVSLGSMMRDGTPIVVAFVTDITRRRRAERELRSYEHKLRRMAFDAVLTEERERRRLAIELHDSIGQDLALAQIKLGPLRSDLSGEARIAVDAAVKLIEKAIDDSRTLVFELSPPVLYDLGLREALAWLAEDVGRRHGIKLEIIDDGADKPLDDAAKSVIFRAVRECVINVVKHAKVPKAVVSLRRSDDYLLVDVQDQGRGFDHDLPVESRSPGSFGLLSVREQIGQLGGTLKVTSARQKGTVVGIRVPLRAGEVAPGPGRDSFDGGGGP
jgi:PAS domain S-box-containing protein